AYRDQGDLAGAIGDYGRALDLRRTLVESEGRRALVGDLASTFFNRAVTRMDMEAWDDARADLDAGGGLLHEAVRGGRIDLTPSFIKTVAGRIRALDRLGRPEVIRPWVDDLAQRLPPLASQFAENPLWKPEAVALAEAVSANQALLQQAGVGAERLLHALGPFIERPDEPDAVP
ncbi:MAG: hypothetical protein HQ582_21660, partial [Planctomycetes bacterium]|nr:hypothetical protein [Planctomycetota bacterium]